MSDEEQKPTEDAEGETDDSLAEGAPPSAGEDEEEDAADSEEPAVKKEPAAAKVKRERKATKGTKASATKPVGKRSRSVKSEDEKPKKKKSPQTHPRTLDMVVEALEEMKDVHGSSVQAIKGWIIANYKTVRPDMIKLMLRRAFVQGVAEGLLARPKGQSETQMLSGRYKLGQGSEHSPPAGSKSRPRIKKVEPPKKSGKGRGRPKGKAKSKTPVAAVKVAVKSKPIVAKKSAPKPLKEKSKGGKRGRPKGGKKGK